MELTFPGKDVGELRRFWQRRYFDLNIYTQRNGLFLRRGKLKAGCHKYLKVRQKKVKGADLEIGVPRGDVKNGDILRIVLQLEETYRVRVGWGCRPLVKHSHAGSPIPVSGTLFFSRSARG